MRKFSSELGHNYDFYTFGYANYCEKEPGDSLEAIYAFGYLPYSGAKDTKNIFYMARSARVDLKNFALTSENRRIAKKFEGVFEKERIPFSRFSVDENFLSFCLDYFAKKHGVTAMPRERFEMILASGLISNTTIYRSDGKTAAYVLEVEEGGFGHYWFSFYDLSLAHQSLGLFLMQDSIEDAKKRGLTHYYLGTVYGEKALYKTNFEPLEWWSGESWSADIKLLKERGRGDSVRLVLRTDAWKEDKNLFKDA